MAGSVVLSAVQWIGSLLIQEGKVLYEVEDQVRSLQEDLEVMQQYLQDADAKQEAGEVRALVSQIRKLAYDAEDAIDTYIVKVQAKVGRSNRRWVMRSACLLYNAPHIYEIGNQIQVIQTNLQRVTEKFNSYGVRKITNHELGEGLNLSRDGKYSRQKPRSYPYDDDDGQYVVGWERDISKLVEVLMGEGKNQVSILSIVGMGGSGKTTLARKLYNHPYIRECFNCTAWVFISQEWNTLHILSQILRKVGGPKEMAKLHVSVEELVDELRNILMKKSYLIVLDDVWRREALKDILPALPRGNGNSNKGSKIIITTRNREIIQFPILHQHQCIYEPPPLNEHEAWELFSKIALDHRTDYNMESFERLGEDMLKQCDGLPLAIVALSGILNTKDTIREWQLVKEAVRSKVMDGIATNMYGRVEDLLALSYDDLPYDLKPCFLYLGIFPEDCHIPVGMLTRMWMAEGFITAHGGMSLEDVALQRLEELSHRFMVQIVRTNFKGEIKAVRVHDLLRDLSIKKAKEESFLQIYAPCPGSSDAPKISMESRRFAIHSSVSFPTQVSHLRSLVLLTRSSVSYSAYASKETLSLEVVYNNFKLLRLLNLWGIKTADSTLPAQIGSLVHLRYLGIRASNITKLPSSIGNLRNLLTLDYRNIDSDASVPIKIPSSLGKLVLLRQLFLPIECPWSVEDLQLSAMKNLQILWGVKQAGGGNWLSREVAQFSTTLKKLKIVVSTEEELASTFCCPSLLYNGLRTFHCEMRNGVALQQVDPLCHHQDLHKLTLIGEIRMKLSLILPLNLVMLELKNCMLKDEDPMAATGKLPHLKLLRMSNSYLGTTFACKAGSFPQLEELYLEDFKKLRIWDIEKGSMLCLKKLEIIGCKEMWCFPKGLLFVTTLQDLEYFGLPKEFGQVASECGWSQKRLRLPHNYEAIICQCDSFVDTSSINKLYEQLTAGVFLNHRQQKYWVVRQEDHYYNCFMLYAKHILELELDQGSLGLHPSVLLGIYQCWELSKMTESDGTPITVAKVKKPFSHLDRAELCRRFDTKNLSLAITYGISYVIMLPESACARPIPPAECTLFVSGCPVEKHQHPLDDKPRDQWIRLLVGTLKISQDTGLISFFLGGMGPGVLIKGVIIEPVF